MKYEFPQIDGLPRGYIEISDGTTAVRLIYQSIVFCWFPSEEMASEALALIFKRMADAFSKELLEDGTPYIIWRMRPVIERSYDLGIHLRMRLATSPPLPKEFWDRYGMVDGTLHAQMRRGEDLFR